jgi:hypothetical protein
MSTKHVFLPSLLPRCSNIASMALLLPQQDTKSKMKFVNAHDNLSVTLPSKLWFLLTSEMNSMTLPLKTLGNFNLLPLHDLVDENGDPRAPIGLCLGAKPMLCRLHVLLCPCVTNNGKTRGPQDSDDNRKPRKVNKHSICAKRGVKAIHVGLPCRQNGWLCCFPSTHVLVSGSTLCTKLVLFMPVLAICHRMQHALRLPSRSQ